jgi:hypothetical protein
VIVRFPSDGVALEVKARIMRTFRAILDCSIVPCLGIRFTSLSPHTQLYLFTFAMNAQG